MCTSRAMRVEVRPATPMSRSTIVIRPLLCRSRASAGRTACTAAAATVPMSATVSATVFSSRSKIARWASSAARWKRLLKARPPTRPATADAMSGARPAGPRSGAGRRGRSPARRSASGRWSRAAWPRPGWRTGRGRRTPCARSRSASPPRAAGRGDDQDGGEGPASVWPHGGASLRQGQRISPRWVRHSPTTSGSTSHSASVSRRAPTRCRPSGARSSAPARTWGPASARRRPAPPAGPRAPRPAAARTGTRAAADARRAAPRATPEIMPVPSETDGAG